MSQIRYGAKVEQRNREVEATRAEIWSTAVTAVWETDPEVIAAVLPPPLEPAAEPLVRLTITTVDMPGLPVFGAGWFGVPARHGDQVGEYPLFMPMTTEQASIGGRETYGEPKKIGAVWARRDGDPSTRGIERMGFTLCEIHGTLGEAREPYEKTKRDFCFKLCPSAERQGLDPDPLLVYGEKNEKARVHEGIDGEVVLNDSPLDPDRRHPRSAGSWTSTGPSGPPPRTARSSTGCPGEAPPVRPPALRRPVRPREEELTP